MFRLALYRFVRGSRSSFELQSLFCLAEAMLRRLLLLLLLSTLAHAVMLSKSTSGPVERVSLMLFAPPVPGGTGVRVTVPVSCCAKKRPESGRGGRGARRGGMDRRRQDDDEEDMEITTYVTCPTCTADM